MTQLNEQQQKAAEVKEGVFIVIAGCGSGKTLTMTHRIGYLVQSGISPENILGLTFTRNAAQTMRDRLVSVLEDQASRVTLSTLHSFCHHILKVEGVPFEVITDRDQLILLKKIIRQRKYDDLSVGTVIREISLSKNNLIDVDEFMELYEGDRTMQRVGEVYRDYERQKAKK